MSKSPRFADWSSEVNSVWNEARRAAEARRDKTGDFDIQADDAIRLLRVGLDVRRAAFGVAGPSGVPLIKLCANGRRRNDRERRHDRKRGSPASCSRSHPPKLVQLRQL